MHSRGKEKRGEGRSSNLPKKTAAVPTPSGAGLSTADPPTTAGEEDVMISENNEGDRVPSPIMGREFAPSVLVGAPFSSPIRGEEMMEVDAVVEVGVVA
jgi:hypothetical protein